MSKRWDVDLYWFDDDEHDTDVEADTAEEAARKTYDEWHPTGWTHAVVGGIDVDLDAPDFESAIA